jgi:hypothetical protein
MVPDYAKYLNVEVARSCFTTINPRFFNPNKSSFEDRIEVDERATRMSKVSFSYSGK